MLNQQRVMGLLLALLMLCGVVMGCQPANSNDRAKGSRELQVYITNNAPDVREKALSYGLDVKTIDGNSTESQLIQALLNSPTDKYFVVINPYHKRYIAGGAVSNESDKAELDSLFREMKQVSKAGEQQLPRLFPSQKGHARLVVFSDFQCPYCKMLEAVTNQWKQQYGDKLELEFIHFPLPSHEHAFAAAEAAECARAQGKFDEYKDALFENQESLSEYTFNRLANQVKLDYRQFTRCTSLHQERKKVRQDQYFGKYMGISGTPTMVLNGDELIMGKTPEQIQAMIEESIGALPPAPAETESPEAVH